MTEEAVKEDLVFIEMATKRMVFAGIIQKSDLGELYSIVQCGKKCSFKFKVWTPIPDENDQYTIYVGEVMDVVFYDYAVSMRVFHETVVKQSEEKKKAYVKPSMGFRS